MKSEATIIIASYGSEFWRDLGDNRALPSAVIQGDYEIIRIHHPSPDTNLSELRNEAAANASGERLLFLDADDLLEPGYVDAMLRGSGTIRYPMLRVMEDPEQLPLPDAYEIQRRPLLSGNFMVIGSCIPRSLFMEIGGFPNYEAAEDWAMLLSAWCAGATMELCRDAIYRQIWRPNSRNQMEHGRYAALCQTIRDRYTIIAKEVGLI